MGQSPLKQGFGMETSDLSPSSQTEGGERKLNLITSVSIQREEDEILVGFLVNNLEIQNS